MPSHYHPLPKLELEVQFEVDSTTDLKLECPLATSLGTSLWFEAIRDIGMTRTEIIQMARINVDETDQH
jgi:hypothetical protein